MGSISEPPAYAELAVTSNFSFLRGASHPLAWQAGRLTRVQPVDGGGYRFDVRGLRLGMATTPAMQRALRDFYAAQIEAAIQLGAPVVEFHTGEYAHAFLDGDAERVTRELRRITDMAALAAKNGIEPHAGHGLTFDNVGPIAAIPQIKELNIGHFLIAESVFIGLPEAIREMRRRMDEART